jgi:hypothetical protein
MPRRHRRSPLRCAPMHTLTRAAACFLGAALALGACGDEDLDTEAAGRTTETTETTIDDTTGNTAETEPTSAELPGERIEIFPYEDASLAVVGVEADDVLNVRSGPGVDFDVVAELDPLATGITATGHNRSVDDEGFWSEVSVDGATGWANVAFLAHPGRVDDIATQIAPTPDDLPMADTMEQLGQMVAEKRTSDEPASGIVVVDGPTVGDLGEITVDVIGFGDDALGGERLRIFGQPDPAGEGFVLDSVERTLLCTRGVTADGLCV